MSTRLRAALPVVLVVVLGLLYGWVGASAHGWDRAWGIGGGVLVLTALLLAPRSGPAASALLLVGALPLAVATWWSLVTPLLAILVLALGTIAVRRRSHDPGRVGGRVETGGQRS